MSNTTDAKYFARAVLLSCGAIVGSVALVAWLGWWGVGLSACIAVAGVAWACVAVSDDETERR